MGKNLGTSVRIPGADAKPEDVAAFHTKLGRPEAAEKYEYAGPENLAERFQTDDETINSFRKIAFNAGYTPAQFKAATDFYNGILTMYLNFSPFQHGSLQENPSHYNL